MVRSHNNQPTWYHVTLWLTCLACKSEREREKKWNHAMERRREEREERKPCSWSSVKPYGVQWTLYILSVYLPSLLFAKYFSWHFILLLSSFRLIWLLGALSSSGSSAMKTPPILCNLRLREVLTFSEHTNASVPKFCFFWNMHVSSFLTPFHATYVISRFETQPVWTECIWLLRTPPKEMCTASTFRRPDTFIFVTCSNNRPHRVVILNVIIQSWHWWCQFFTEQPAGLPILF